MQTSATNLEEEPASIMSENTSLSGQSGRIEDAGDSPAAGPGSDLFEDSECGEPLLAQHLVLDFTPTEHDTDYIQKKCCAFWEFVKEQPELEALAALTDVDMSEEMSESGDYGYVSSRERSETTPKLKSLERTAVSMLELVEEKGLIDRAFESRLPASHCSVGLANYEDERSDRDENNNRARGDHAEPPKLSISVSQKTKSQVMKKRTDAVTSPSVQAMCHELQAWDKQHPKSMEPPGPAPALENDVTKQPAVPKPTKQCTCKTTNNHRPRTTDKFSLQEPNADTERYRSLKCRPTCKSRRRGWRGELQTTSAELLLERRPARECFRRWPTEVYPNSPCPLVARTRHVTVTARDPRRPPDVVRICQAPIDDVVDTPYLKLAQMVKNLGAMDAVKSRCPFCGCARCCGCRARHYEPADATRDRARRRDMRDFDARVRRDCRTMRTMYR